MSRTVFLFVQIVFLQCKITEAVKQSGKIIQGHGLQETTVILVTASCWWHLEVVTYINRLQRYVTNIDVATNIKWRICPQQIVRPLDP